MARPSGSRERFEAWARSVGITALDYGVFDGYRNGHVAQRWDAWQAAAADMAEQCAAACETLDSRNARMRRAFREEGHYVVQQCAAACRALGSGNATG